MEEKNLLAFFPKIEDAQECQSRLRHEGFDVVQIDPIPTQSAYDTLNNTRMLEGSILLEDVLATGADSANLASQGIIADAWLFTAVVPAAERDRVARIISDHGGQL